MEKGKTYQWHRIAGDKSELIFPLNGLLEIEVNRKQICLAKVDDNLYACTTKCPHAGGVISNGFIDPQNNVVCPLHRYRFDLQNGRNVSGEGYFLKIYPIRETSEGVYLGMEKSGISFW